jgi:hypothetical protein
MTLIADQLRLKNGMKTSLNFCQSMGKTQLKTLQNAKLVTQKN